MEIKANTFRHKLLAWLLAIAMAVGMAPVTASAAASHTHAGMSFSPGVGQGVLRTCNCYLSHDEKVALPSSGIVVSGSGVTVNICLNGHTLDLNGTQIWINNGATVNIYDCSGGNGKIIGGGGSPQFSSDGTTKGGAFYVRGSTLNIYGGTIEDNQADWGGAIFIDGSGGAGVSTVNMHGGTIRNNRAELGGGGIEVENGGSVFNMFGGSIVNNTVTKTDDARIPNATLYKPVHKGGGVHYAAGTMSIQGKVNITGNTVAGEMDNVYLRNGVTLTVGKIAAGSRIGVSSFDVEYDYLRYSSNPTKDKTITSGYASKNPDFASSVQCFYMDSLHTNEKYALVLDGCELAIKRQTHTWQYEKVSGKENQIRAYCVNEEHTCAFKKTGTNTPTLTLNADDVVYSGEQYNGISYGEEEETKWEYAGLDMPTVQYTGTSAAGEPYSNTTPPTNAGTYTASIT